ncbi:response regulator transcription factor [Catellatospora tritici]|uniref:response regulator transcription factor n=1 Tax=Catellatospora tritici TaxID=2851566 RepID=UPI001C2DE71A|nr:response regulator transcription factor [Catellatospora tritici]MBV1854410.1 response regulator transcription factor [Catellatospora tritici]
MTTGSQLLVADDDPSVRKSLDRALRLEGYQVHLAADGTEALIKVMELRPDLLLLDVMMPGLNGLDTCRRLRAAADHTPVLMLTARDAVADRVAGLDAGADDYLVKPFALQELLARVRALLRRTGPLTDIDDVLRVGDLTLNRRTRQVRRGGTLIELTRTEFNLLQTLLEHKDRVLTRTQLFEHVWGFDLNQSSNSLDVYIGYLRRKLEADGRPRLLHTVRGVGFVLRPDEQCP